jgi:osmotically-inducible protein OsmY
MDSDICAAVHQALVTDPRIDADGITVDMWNGEVRLTGAVPSQTQRSEAVAVAQRVAGATVQVLLAIEMPSSDAGDDTALAQLVNEALAGTRAVPDTVQATAHEGYVSLTGTVSHSSQRSAAEDAAAGVGGILGITNQIEVQSGA